MGSLLIGLLIGFFLGIAAAIHRYFVRPDDTGWIMAKAGKAAARYMESLDGEPMTATGHRIHVGDSPLGERWMLDYQLYRERYADQVGGGCAPTPLPPRSLTPRHPPSRSE